MAKKKETMGISKIGSILDNIAKTIPIQIKKEPEKRVFISTGVYILNAALSADMLNGGIASNRISVFAGKSGTGKSYLAYSVAKHAQKEGYLVIYIDTEQSIDLIDLPNYGIDISSDKLKLIVSNKVEDVSMTLTQLLDELKEEKVKNGSIPKIMIVIDSLGQMASNKEKEDLLKGDIKVDMTKAKALGAMFRSINTDLGFLDIPLLVCNQTYDTMDFISKEELKGGQALRYTASVIGMMSKAKLKTGEEDDMDLNQSGITVTFRTDKNRLAKPKKIKFDISFIHGMNPYTGLEAFCRPEFYDKIGIAKGKEVVDKKTGEVTFEPGGTRWFIRHLNKSVFAKNLHTPEIFTEDVLKAMSPIVNDYFKFKSIEEQEAAQKEFEKIMNEEDETNGFSDEIDAEDLFD